MIDEPRGPSEQYVFENERQNYDDCWPDHGEYSQPRKIEANHQRQAHHRTEQLWSRDK